MFRQCKAEAITATTPVENKETQRKLNLEHCYALEIKLSIKKHSFEWSFFILLPGSCVPLEIDCGTEEIAWSVEPCLQK